jgi:DNA-binding NtrC family response regulator
MVLGTARILVIDDEKSMRNLLSLFLTKEGYQVESAESGEKALSLLKEDHFDLVITDIIMPGMDGLETLKQIIQLDPTLPVIMITAYATTATTLESMKIGAVDYITKPFKLDELKTIIARTLEKKRLEEDSADYSADDFPMPSESLIIGRSEKILEVCKILGKVAEKDVTVLIRGESGTGKELIARQLHFHSRRKEYPFITVNCAAIPRELLESELFGHEKGAFTGAISSKIGKFQLAHRGTIFLDEIGDLELSLQGKILRVLQEKEIERVGGTENIKIDVRVIAATNQNLEQAIKEKRFREDLFYRLNVVPIVLPPLRERKEDIPLLAHHFLKKYQNTARKKIMGISPSALRLLQEYSWPGNVRELENVIERAIALETSNIISSENLPEEIRKGAKEDILSGISEQGLDIDTVIDNLEKDLILKALEKTQGVKTEAAKLLNLSFRSLRYRLKKHHIE